MTSIELNNIKNGVLAMPTLFANEQDVCQYTYQYTGSGTSPTLSIDESVFATKISHVAGEYVFTFSTSEESSSWKLNSESIVLSQYGIGVQGSPNNGDTIIVHYNIDLIPKSSSDNSVSFDTGYPATYDNAGQNAKAIERNKMNWLLRVLSQGSFFGQTGIRYTFNANVATAIGGYPRGAILAHDDGISIRNVVSLKDDNTYNFLINGVDDKNWRYLDSYDNAGIFPDYGQCGYLIYATMPQNSPNITQMCEWVPMPENGWIYPQFTLVSGITTYLVLGPADGTVPSNVVFTGDVYEDMILPGADNASEQGINEMPYSIFLLGNNYYSNKNLIPVRKGTKLAVFGKNTSSTVVNMSGVWIRMYRNYYR